VLWAFGAAPDHVHVLVQLPVVVTIADIMQRLKGATSRVFRRELPGGWQAGYWVESVSPQEAETVARYVRRQRVHHMSDGGDEPWSK
jgi:putative transposase